MADEAHVIRNDKTQVFRALVLLQTRRRLALTGYPLQNNLEEYARMLAWVKPGLFTADDFRRKFSEPIRAGACRRLRGCQAAHNDV